MKVNKVLVICLGLFVLLVTIKQALGGVVINEIMQNPNAVTDTNGEYFELYNDGLQAMDINGWTIKDNGTNTHTINNGGPLNVPAGGYSVLCINKNNLTNGGFNCDYEYSSFTLGNDADEVILMNGTTEMDSVYYDNGARFPDPDGASMELYFPYLDNNNGTNWREALMVFGSGDRGTPGRLNNLPPILNISSDNVSEDSGLKKYELHNFSTDLEDAVSNLTFIINSQSNSSLINCVLNIDGHNLDCTTKANQSGASVVQITVRDQNGGNGTTLFTIVVNPVNDGPILTIGDRWAKENETLNLNLSNFGYDIDTNETQLILTLTNSTESSVTIVNKALTWTPSFSLVAHPNTTKEVMLTVNLSDGQLSDQKMFKITVNDTNQKPTASLTGILEFMEDVEKTYQVTASDQDGDNLTYFLSGNVPAGLGINASGIISWKNPVKGNYGNVTVTADDGQNKANSQTNISSNLTVKPGLEITSVKINGNAITKNGTTNTFYFSDELSLEVAVKNNMDRAITGIATQLDASENNLDAIAEGTYNLGAGSSQTITFKKQIPFNVSKGSYLTALKVEGVDYNNNTIKRNDEFGFTLKIEQKPADVTITKLSWKNNKNATYCDQSLNLGVEYTNGGSNTENDIRIIVRDANGKINLSSGVLAALGPNQKAEREFYLNLFNLSQGEQTITAELSYRNEFNKNSQTITTIKNKCFSAPAVNIAENTPNSAILTIDLADKNYTLSKGASNYSETVSYALTSQSNSTLVSCSLTSAGMLSCGNLASNGFGSSILNISLTAGTTINPEQVTVIVNGVNSPPVILLGNFNFMEDQYYEADLTAMVSDVDNLLSSLTFGEDAPHLALEKTGSKLKFTSSKDWYGTETFNFSASDGVNVSTKQITATVTLNQTDDKATITSSYPTETAKTIKENENLAMGMTINNPDSMSVSIKWYVNGTEKGSGQQYTFNAVNAGGKIGNHNVTAKLLYGTEELGSAEWRITAVDRPVDIGGFSGSATTDVSKVQTIAQVNGLVLENSYGKISFNESVDLSEIVYLANLVKIQDKLVTIDSANAAGLNKKATITLYNTGLTRAVVKKTSQFTTDASKATELTTITASVSSGAVTFEVPSFSTYAVVEDIAAELSLPTEVTFDEAAIGATAAKNFTVTNIGSRESISNIQVSSTAESKYSVKFYETNGNELSNFNLGVGEKKEIMVKAVVPSDITGGKTQIGAINFNYGNKSKTMPLNMQTKSLLEITSVKLNGKTSGEFKLGEKNEISVEVKNNGLTTSEDVTIKITVKDIDDGDDEEEESDEFDLRAGEKEEEEIEFEVGTELDEEDYEVEIEVEAKGKTAAEESKRFEVKRDKHNIVIKEATLPETVYCNKYPTLYVELENQGESDEKEVAVKISSSQLGIEEQEAGIELGDYSDSDNDYQASFPLDLSKAEKGTYTFEVKAYRDTDELEDSKSLSLTIGDCVTTYASEQTESYTSQLVSQAQKQLQQAASQPTPTAITTVKSSFRESKTYLVMIGTLAFLLLVTVILGIAVLMKRRK